MSVGMIVFFGIFWGIIIWAVGIISLYLYEKNRWDWQIGLGLKKFFKIKILYGEDKKKDKKVQEERSDSCYAKWKGAVIKEPFKGIKELPDEIAVFLFSLIGSRIPERYLENLDKYLETGLFRTEDISYAYVKNKVINNAQKIIKSEGRMKMFFNDYWEISACIRLIAAFFFYKKRRKDVEDLKKEGKHLVIFDDEEKNKVLSGMISNVALIDKGGMKRDVLFKTFFNRILKNVGEIRNLKRIRKEVISSSPKTRESAQSTMTILFNEIRKIASEFEKEFLCVVKVLDTDRDFNELFNKIGNLSAYSINPDDRLETWQIVRLILNSAGYKLGKKLEEKNNSPSLLQKKDKVEPFIYSSNDPETIKNITRHQYSSQVPEIEIKKFIDNVWRLRSEKSVKRALEILKKLKQSNSELSLDWEGIKQKLENKLNKS